MRLIQTLRLHKNCVWSIQTLGLGRKSLVKTVRSIQTLGSKLGHVKTVESVNNVYLTTSTLFHH